MLTQTMSVLKIFAVFLLFVSLTDAAAHLRRARSQHNQELHAWLTDAQKEELKNLDSTTIEFKNKVGEFYAALPADEKNKWNDIYKKQCFDWTSKVQNEAEQTEFQELLNTQNVEKVRETVSKLKVKLSEEDKKKVELWEDECFKLLKSGSRKRREIDSAFQDFLKWMTPEQKAEYVELKTAGKSQEEIREKIKGFFGELPAEKQTALKTEFKDKCRVFFKPLMTSEEFEKIQTLKGDKPAIRALVKGVVDRQVGEVKQVAGKMYELCGEVFKDASRKRREIDSAFEDFVKWMTPEQKSEIGEFKTSGKSQEEIRLKIKGFFEQLPAVRQTELKIEFKGKCKSYFTQLLTPEEAEKLKTIKDDRTAAAVLIKGVVDRQEGDIKKVAEKMYNLCGEIYKEPTNKRKRDVRSKIEKHLAWLRPEEKDEIVKMTESGQSKDDIRKKLFDFVAHHEKDGTQKEKTIKNCYQWMDEVATKEEIENLHKLHHVDHGACKKKVREFISRLPTEKQQAVEASLPFCEKLWYGDHADHSAHHEHHHERKRRHLSVLEKYLSWMDDEQKNAIKQLESEGTEFAKIADKIREFFGKLPEEKRTDLKSKFKTQCLTWAKEVALPGEWEEIKRHYGAKDFNQLKEKLVDLEGRLTENQKHTIEHVRGICYNLWGIHLARLRRVVKIPSISARTQGFKKYSEKYLRWLSDEQLEKLETLYYSEKHNQFVGKMLEIYEKTNDDEKESAEQGMKSACLDHSTMILGTPRANVLQGYFENEVPVNKIMSNILNWNVEEKHAVETIIQGCSAIHKAINSRTTPINQDFNQYLYWVGDEENE